MQFSGLILTDDVAMKALQFKGSSIADNVVRALDAGCDMVMCSVQNAAPLIAAVVKKAETDAAFAARLDDAVLHVLETKKQAGLIDGAGAVCPVPQPDLKTFQNAFK